MRLSLLCIGLVACVTWATERQSVATESPQSNVATNLHSAKVVTFTFGTPTSVTRTGFVKVTVNDVFTAQKGYGFKSTQGLVAYDRGGSEIVRPKDEYTASVYGAYRTTSDLTCALVEGTSENVFIVALPDGEYTV